MHRRFRAARRGPLPGSSPSHRAALGLGRRAALGLGRRAALGLLAATATGRRGQAQDKPQDKTLTLLVGAAPGSGPDRWARSFAPFLERHAPHRAVTVLNRPGEGGLAAARSLAAAPADGRRLGSVATPLLLARAVEAGEAGLLEQLEFLAAVAEEPLVLVGHPGTVTDLAALRGLGPQAILGTPPAGSAAQLAGRALSQALPLGGLAFANAAAARQAVIDGNIPCAMLAAPEAIGALREGRLLALGVALARRSPLLPEAPTLTELGIPLVALAQRGFTLPQGVPAAQREMLLGSLQAAVADPEFTVQAEALGMVPHFLQAKAWEAQLHADAATLATRWLADPWTGRRD